MLMLTDDNVIDRFIQAKVTNNPGYGQDCIKYMEKNFNKKIWFNYNDKLKKTPEKDLSEIGTAFDKYESKTKYWKYFEFPNFKIIRRFQYSRHTNVHNEPYDSDDDDDYFISKIYLLKDIIQFYQEKTSQNEKFRVLIYVNKIPPAKQFPERFSPSHIAKFVEGQNLGPCELIPSHSYWGSREHTVARFRQKNRCILVATADDLLDIDLPEVHLVINFEIPEPSCYQELERRTLNLNKGPTKVIQHWIFEDEDLKHASKFLKFLEEESKVYRTSSYTTLQCFFGESDKEVDVAPDWLQLNAICQDLQENMKQLKMPTKSGSSEKVSKQP